MTNLQLLVKQPCLLSSILNAANNFEKTVKLISFQNPELQSVSIFLNFVHPSLLLHLPCYLYLLLMFWGVIFNVSLHLVAFFFCGTARQWFLQTPVNWGLIWEWLMLYFIPKEDHTRSNTVWRSFRNFTKIFLCAETWATSIREWLMSFHLQ